MHYDGKLKFHLCAIRYTLLFYAEIQNKWQNCEARKKVGEQLTLLSYGQKM